MFMSSLTCALGNTVCVSRSLTRISHIAVTAFALSVAKTCKSETGSGLQMHEAL